jgi:hypothetical protein
MVLYTADSDGVVHDEDLDPESEWMTCEFCKANPVLCWLPTKLAEWIGANLSNDLLIPGKKEDKWAEAQLSLTSFSLIVRGPHCQLCTFGGIKRECGLFNRGPKAQCYPFNIDCHCFRDKNPQVSCFILYMI